MRNPIVTIRAARTEEFARLAEIELNAFAVWAKACFVSSQPSSSPQFVLQQSLDQGFLLVAEELGSGRLTGFAAAHVVGRYLHIVEVDVEPDLHGKGIGKALMLSLLEKGRHEGLGGAVLTTDRFAPFNGPFYAKLGFEILTAADVPGFIQERLDSQVASGLDPQRRVAMQMELDGTNSRSSSSGN